MEQIQTQRESELSNQELVAMSAGLLSLLMERMSRRQLLTIYFKACETLEALES